MLVLEFIFLALPHIFRVKSIQPPLQKWPYAYDRHSVITGKQQLLRPTCARNVYNEIGYSIERVGLSKSLIARPTAVICNVSGLTLFSKLRRTAPTNTAKYKRLAVRLSTQNY